MMKSQSRATAILLACLSFNVVNHQAGSKQPTNARHMLNMCSHVFAPCKTWHKILFTWFSLAN